MRPKELLDVKEFKYGGVESGEERKSFWWGVRTFGGGFNGGASDGRRKREAKRSEQSLFNGPTIKLPGPF